MTFRHPARRAFSLVEVIVAMTIFAVGFAGVITAVSMSVRRAGDTYRSDRAVEIARRVMTVVTATPAEQRAAHGGEEDRYRWSVDLDRRPHDLVAATVTVRWAERNDMRTFRLHEIFLPRRTR
ncbi:MAG: hypothetical protein CMJ18_04620 [Phycisphaeraceae bacterium]|nr:hypothetical protein [Phycisphaeraceae bacterium]